VSVPRRRRLQIGTSGWQYADWRGPVYSTPLPQRRWLEHYAELFATVEVNNTFYRLPEGKTFESWAEHTPDDFTFSVKASRYVTHVRRLRAPAQGVHRLMRAAAGLGPKLGVVLLQLPPHFAPEARRLDAALRAFGDGVRVAVELRDERWHRDEVYEVLRRHRAALVWWDRLGRHGPLERTASWCYVRLHQGRGHGPPAYGRRALATWCDRILEASGPYASRDRKSVV